MLNPTNAALTTITFQVASAGTTTDDLGNPVPNRGTATVEAILTPLRPSDLQWVAAAVGVEPIGIPVKVRAYSYPAELPRLKKITGSLEYAGQPALVDMVIGAVNPHVIGLGLALGQSCYGVLRTVG